MRGGSMGRMEMRMNDEEDDLHLDAIVPVQPEHGELFDIEDVRAQMHERYANWPRAAE